VKVRGIKEVVIYEDQCWTRTTRSRQSRPPASYQNKMTAAAVTITLPETTYYQLLYEAYDDDDEGSGCEEEMACVEARLGGEFQHTSELHAMKYKQVMKIFLMRGW